MNSATKWLACLSVFVCIACQTPASKSADKQPATKTSSPLPAFSGDSAWRYTEAQTLFGPRTPNSPAHNACEQYLVATMTRFGATLTQQKANLIGWDNATLRSTNIIASFYPEKTERILLCAHWDSRPWADHDPNPANHKTPLLGANDGASGVGVLMELARLLGQKELTTQPTVGVDIVFFDAEDYGTPSWFEGEATETSWCLGSQHWAKKAKESGYKARYGILLDMVGDRSPTFYMESFSLKNASAVVGKVWSTAASLGYSYIFLSQQGGSITDDHLSVQEIAGIPCIDIIDYDPTSYSGFVSYWHTLGDDMSNIDSKTLKVVGETLVKVVFTE